MKSGFDIFDTPPHPHPPPTYFKIIGRGSWREGQKSPDFKFGGDSVGDDDTRVVHITIHSASKKYPEDRPHLLIPLHGWLDGKHMRFIYIDDENIDKPVHFSIIHEAQGMDILAQIEHVLLGHYNYLRSEERRKVTEAYSEFTKYSERWTNRLIIRLEKLREQIGREVDTKKNVWKQIERKEDTLLNVRAYCPPCRR